MLLCLGGQSIGEISKFTLPGVIQHIKRISERHEILSLEEIAGYISMSKDWSDYVDKYWSYQNVLSGQYQCVEDGVSNEMSVWTVFPKTVGDGYEFSNGHDDFHKVRVSKLLFLN